MSDESVLCPDCKTPVTDEGDYKYCSDFCCVVPESDRKKWHSFKEGDFGVYPCADCGLALEDEYTPGSVCSSCHRAARIRVRAELLTEALSGMTKELEDRIRKELES